MEVNMGLFNPYIEVESIFDVTPELLSYLDVKALLLDVDNTLALFKTHKPIEGVREWIENMKSAGVGLYILSNAKSERCKKFAQKVGLPYFAMSAKPLPFKINKAAKKVANNKKRVALVGDQIFTDVLGGNLAGIITILTQPIQLETQISFKIRRKLEKSFRENRGGI
jgi:HAD superfamily phosphatase (TIGR01668 family)